MIDDDDKAYIATLIGPDGDECGHVCIYARDMASARGLLMSIGINDYCELTQAGWNETADM